MEKAGFLSQGQTMTCLKVLNVHVDRGYWHLCNGEAHQKSWIKTINIKFKIIELKLAYLSTSVDHKISNLPSCITGCSLAWPCSRHLYWHVIVFNFSNLAVLPSSKHSWTVNLSQFVGEIQQLNKLNNYLLVNIHILYLIYINILSNNF